MFDSGTETCGGERRMIARLILWATLFAALLAARAPAQAQSYPNRPIKLVTGGEVIKELF